jgi:hypothetical protein
MSIGSETAVDEIPKAQSSFIGDHNNGKLHDSDAADDNRSICKALRRCVNPQIERPGTIDRNAQFHSLSSQEREHLDCVEYQAVRLLSYVVPAYIIAWQFFGCIAIGAYMACDERGAAAANAVNLWFVSRDY